MKFQLEEELQERFRFSNELFEAGEYHSALTYLAEIFHCLPLLSSAGRSQWINRLEAKKLSVEMLETAVAGTEEQAKIIRRILSFGSTWNDDEILLVLTKRIQIELLLAFLIKFCGSEVAVNTHDIDELIKRISQTKENRRSFEIATNLMQKNWGLPIESSWLRLESSNDRRI